MTNSQAIEKNMHRQFIKKHALHRVGIAVEPESGSSSGSSLTVKHERNGIELGSNEIIPILQSLIHIH